MGRFIDMTNKKYGKLLVLNRDHDNINKYGHIHWICKCNCGNTKSIKGDSIRGGLTKSCGCGMTNQVDVICGFCNKKISKPKWRVKKTKKIFCDKICFEKFRKSHTITKCGFCNNQIKVYKSRQKSINYCSKKCADTWRKHNPRKDLTGMRFGKLSVVKMVSHDKHRRVLWGCLCDCGSKKITATSNLTCGASRHCGCVESKTSKKNIIGKKYGKLTVVKERTKRRSGRIQFDCNCDCGETAIVNGKDLRLEHTKSCGCMGYRDRVKFVGTKNGKQFFICTECNEKKEWSKFGKDSRCPYGIIAICARCLKEQKAEYHKRQSDDLTDIYITGLLCKYGDQYSSDDYLKSVTEIPKELIGLKRLHLQTTRIIKQRKEEIKQCHR